MSNKHSLSKSHYLDPQALTSDTDQQEFYQLLSYKGDVDLEAKLDEWERFYNFARPHGAHNGQTPYEALRDKLQ
jgi:transposase InsO family protein